MYKWIYSWTIIKEPVIKITNCTSPKLHLVCSQKSRVSIVFNFSSDGCNTQEKWKTKEMQNWGWGVDGGASNLCYGKSACKWPLYKAATSIKKSEIKGNDWFCQTSGAGPVVCLFQNKIMFLLRTVTQREGSKILSIETKFWPTEIFKGSFLGKKLYRKRPWYGHSKTVNFSQAFFS